jgi:hypothetical protein
MHAPTQQRHNTGLPVLIAKYERTVLQKPNAKSEVNKLIFFLSPKIKTEEYKHKNLFLCPSVFIIFLFACGLILNISCTFAVVFSADKTHEELKTA